MKTQVIELSKIDELLDDFKEFKHRGEDFSDFIRVSGCVERKGKIFDWNYVEEKNLIEVKDKDF